MKAPNRNRRQAQRRARRDTNNEDPHAQRQHNSKSLSTHTIAAPSHIAYSSQVQYTRERNKEFTCLRALAASVHRDVHGRSRDLECRSKNRQTKHSHKNCSVLSTVFLATIEIMIYKATDCTGEQQIAVTGPPVTV